MLQSKDSVSLALKLQNSTLNGRALRVQRCVDQSKGDEQKGPKKKKSKISFFGCAYHTSFAVPLSSSFLLFLYCCGSSSYFLSLWVYVWVSLLSCHVCCIYLEPTLFLVIFNSSECIALVILSSSEFRHLVGG